jgi:hypothetical protein
VSRWPEQGQAFCAEAGAANGVMAQAAAIAPPDILP